VHEGRGVGWVSRKPAALIVKRKQKLGDPYFSRGKRRVKVEMMLVAGESLLESRGNPDWEGTESEGMRSSKRNKARRGRGTAGGLCWDRRQDLKKGKVGEGKKTREREHEDADEKALEEYGLLYN